MEVIRDVDWAAYLDVADRARVRPASDWADEVVANFQGCVADQLGLTLPWPKTHGRIALRAGEMTVWCGVNGHGKSMLLGQVCIGLMQQGAKVCIASLEMRPRWTMTRMCRQMLCDSSPREDWIREIHKWTDGKLWLYDQLGTVEATRMIALGRYVAQDLGVQHLVIDSMMKLGLGDDDYNGQKAICDQLSTLARDTGLHIHLVAHSRKRESDNRPMGKFDVKGSSAITDMADNVISIWRNRDKEEARRKGMSGDGPDCLLICDKQRNGEWEGRVELRFHPPSQQFQDHDGPATPMWQP